MKESHYNFIWVGIIFLSVVGMLILIDKAYANPSELPDYAFTNLKVKEAYEFAKTNGSMLEGLPCNCGCMSNAEAHGGRMHSRGLIDCFMQGNINEGGKWDSHASECGLCYEDALLAKEEYEKGKTKQEIENLLKEKYAKLTFGKEVVYEK